MSNNIFNEINVFLINIFDLYTVRNILSYVNNLDVEIAQYKYDTSIKEVEFCKKRYNDIDTMLYIDYPLYYNSEYYTFKLEYSIKMVTLALDINEICKQNLISAKDKYHIDYLEDYKRNRKDIDFNYINIHCRKTNLTDFYKRIDWCDLSDSD